MSMNINVGERIKELRSARNLTQSELANMIGVRVSTVSSYELSARQPSYDVLIKIAKVFDVTTDSLLGVDKRDWLDGLDSKQVNMVKDMIDYMRIYNRYK
jgi:transcriptional regulator with XRE-family HTH domain